MARTRKKKPEEISLRIVCERQDFDTSIFLSRRYPKYDSYPIGNSMAIRLQGRIVAPPKFKWEVAVINILGSEFSPSTAKKMDDFGYVETRETTIRAMVVWPVESFSNIAALVASQRIQEAKLTITPIKYRSGAVLSLSLDSRSHEDFEKELDFWYGPEN